MPDDILDEFDTLASYKGQRRGIKPFGAFERYERVQCEATRSDGAPCQALGYVKSGRSLCRSHRHRAHRYKDPQP